jgi:hypothetical protein
VNSPNVSSNPPKNSDTPTGADTPKGSDNPKKDETGNASDAGKGAPGGSPNPTRLGVEPNARAFNSLLKVAATSQPGKEPKKPKTANTSAGSGDAGSTGNGGGNDKKGDTGSQTQEKSAAKDINALAPAVQKIVHDVLTTGFEEEECLAVMAGSGAVGVDGKLVPIAETVKIYCDNILQIGVQTTDEQLRATQAQAVLPEAGSSAAMAMAKGDSSVNESPGFVPNPESGEPKGNSAKASGHKEGIVNERLGYSALQSFNYAEAASRFKAANDAYPTLGTASELATFLNTLANDPTPANQCSAIKQISDAYRWRLPGMTKLALHGKYEELHCADAYGAIQF